MHAPIDKINAADSCDISLQAKATCTLITTIKPRIVTKEFSLKPDGSLHKQTSAQVTAGRIETLHFCEGEI